MRKFAVVLSAALFAMGLFAACGGSEETKCSTSRDCAQGTVCQAEKCVEKLCNGTADCIDIEIEICVLGDLVGKDPNSKYCTARECSEFDNSLPCPAGQVCMGGLCQVGEVPQDVIEDSTIEDVDRTDTGTDSGPNIDPSLNCKVCQSDGDCATGYKCLPVGTAKFCLQNCDGANDCPAGYLCYQGSSVSKNCLPVSYNCVECAHDVPCEDGKCCDFVSGECKTCKGECESCTYDFDCEEGSRCLKEGSSPTGVCVAGCKGGATCPAGFTCGANTAGIELCQPDNPDDCRGCPAGQYLRGDGQCVECLNSSHCDNDEVCDQVTNRCLGECGKQFKCDDGICHDCCEDSDCPADSSGNPTGPCQGGKCINKEDECGGTCEGQFPVCAVINGIPQCVECETAADCAVASCICTGNPLYSCVFEDGSVCASSCAATCSSDADCPPGTNGAMLNCHLGSGASGICYDPGGSCDMYTACCAPGQTCFDFLSILFGGVGGGMPGMPGGGLPPTGMAACSCSDQNPCLGGTACTSTSFICLLEMLIPGICVNGQPPSTMPSHLCIDLMKLLGGLFSP